ncbi:MIF4G-like, type 3 [Sesbania bispinosa]|nr:MIF4G-like, type 3 [Sesbania bispinosa]
MSFNQSKSDKSDAVYRKSGRSASFNQQRGSSGGAYVKGGGAAVPSPSLSSSRRVNPPPVNSAESNSAHAARTIPNGSMYSRTIMSCSKSSYFSTPAMNSEPAAPTTPAKGDASKAFPFQFGSISPGFMNVMAIPARTSSAPPNIDEQKRDQTLPSVPAPPVPKHQPAKKDTGVSDLSNAGETYTGTRTKKDTQVSPLPPASHMQKPSVIPITGISMAMPFTSHRHLYTLVVPITDSVSGLQPHPIHPQGIMHQGQSIGFTPQMGPQLPHQLGNMGIGISPQYTPQQGGKFAGPRKTTTVKITHPETHEELRLDKRADTYSDGGSSGARSHSGMPSQSQPVQPFAASHPISYYPSSSYSTSSLFYPPPSSLPLSSSQITPNSQPPRIIMQGAMVCKIISRDVQNAISLPPSGVNSVSIKPSDVSVVVDSSISGVQKSGSPSSSVTSGDVSSSVPPKGSETCSEISSQQSIAASAVTEDSVSVVSNNDEKKEARRSILEGYCTICCLAEEPSQVVDGGISDRGASETIGTRTNHSEAIASKDLSAAASDTTASEGIPYAVEVKTNDSSEISACASAEGPVTQAVDSLNNHKNDELDGLSQQDKLLKQNILDIGGKNENSSLQNVKISPMDESTSCLAECDRMTDNLGLSTSTALDSKDVSLNKNDSVVANEAIATNSGISDQQSADLLETTSKNCKDSSENADSDLLSLPAASGTKDRPILEPSKGPEEKKEAVVSSEKTESVSTSGNLEQLPTDAAQPDDIASEQSKAELDDWEDAADMSTPKLEVPDKNEHVTDGSAVTAKKYSRDFLLMFADQCTDLPEGFEIKKDIAEALMSANISSHVSERDSHPSPGRVIDRSGRMDRHGSGVIEEDKWSKVSGAFHSGMRLDGIGGNAGFRPGQGGNFGVLRNPRTQTPLQYAGGILSGPMQSMVNQGGMQRNSPDSERWQRAASFQQRGLIPSPSPQSPLQMMHKAEKKYEVGKVTDEEEAKQRQLKGILNKLTPQNFEKLFEQVKAVNIDNAVTLTGVISQIFEKALMEPTFCEMYANFCAHLAAALPDLSQDNEKITFKRLLLNKCQEEFERGEREQEEANKADEGEVKQSVEEREEKRTKARRRMLGNIRLIGELYKKKMLTERIMHECIKKLLGQYQDPDEEDIEALCKLMSTIGEMIDHPKAKEHMDAYFERMKLLSNNMNLSSRVRFMLKDVIDLRKNKWQQRRKVEGPKKIEEVHRDASQERQAQASRLGRGPGNNAARRMPMEFGPRGSSMLSPNAQMGGVRGLPTHVRGFGSQDVRMDERQSYEARTLSVPLPQRPLGDDSITLGPQGGLARGMSIRGPPAVSSSTGLNGYSNLVERAPYSSREDLTPRYVPDKFSGPTAYDQSSFQDRNMNYGHRDLRNADRIPDRAVITSPPARVQGTAGSQSTSSEMGWSEERLQDMSMAAIREYYSARDVNEVVLCVKDLNSPSFHPSMVSLWVTDSFERKDTERDLLAQLLVNLVKSNDGTLNQAQLIQGFESVLSTLEDAVNDAPKAPDFLAAFLPRL